MTANDVREALRDAVRRTIVRLEVEGHDVGPLLQSMRWARLAGFIRRAVATEPETKTADAMERMVRNAMRALYDGGEVGDFLDRMADIIAQQLRRAWREALRDLDFDPDEADTTYQEDLYDAIARQYDYVDALADDIVAAREKGLPFDQFAARAALWANRYNEEVSAAKIRIESRLGGRLIWRLGQTEQHCATCAALDGIVAYAREWETLNVHPQGAPNPMLECEGWRCGCRLEPTDRRRSPRAFDSILNIVSRV